MRPGGVDSGSREPRTKNPPNQRLRLGTGQAGTRSVTPAGIVGEQLFRLQRKSLILFFAMGIEMLYYQLNAKDSDTLA